MTRCVPKCAKISSSAVKNGYYEDEYIEYLYGDYTRMLPLINKGTYTRVQAIHRTCFNFILKSGENVQILNIGCGFESLFWRLKEEFPSKTFNFVEVDYEAIVKQKIIKIKESPLSKSISEGKLKGRSSIETPEYKLFSCDLTSDELSYHLGKYLKKEENTLVIAECLLCYIRNDEVHKMIKSITEVVEKTVFVAYDLIKPDDNFGKQLVENLRSRNIELFGIEDTSSCNAQKERLEKLGYTAVCIDMREFYDKHIEEDDKKRIEHLELLDELEELNMLNEHVAFVIGVSTGNEEMMELLDKY